MRKRTTLALASALVLAAAGLAGPARAFTFIDLGEEAGFPAAELQAVEVTSADEGSSFDVYWGVFDPMLSAEATFTVTSYSADAIVLDITLDHTTDLSDSDLENAAILSMGFGVDPDVVATLTSTGSVFDTVDEAGGSQQNFPGGFKQIDVCIFAEGCSGGSINAGLAAGDMDSFQITLTPVSTDFADGVTLAFFPIKFQTSAGSYEPPGSFVPVMPEPTSVALYAIGVLIAAGGGRQLRDLRAA